MTQVVLIVFSLIAASSVHASEGCGENESSNICGRLCEPNCANIAPDPRTCPSIQCTDSITRACRCNKGYFRDQETKRCVRFKNCPNDRRSKRSDAIVASVCGQYERPDECGRMCEGTCTNPNATGCANTTCPGEGCRCRDGFLRNVSTNRCVLAANCPKTQTPRKRRQAKKCRAGEILAACGRRCEGTCQSPRTPEICSRIRCGDLGCRCDFASGYVRDKNTDQCIRISDCRT